MNKTELNPPKALFELSVDVQALCAELRKVEPNQIKPYGELSAIIHGDVQGKRRCTLDSARRILMRDAIVFACVVGVGLKRIVNGDVVDAAADKTQQIRGHIRRGVKLLGCADYDKLDQEKKVAMLTTASLFGALDQATRPKRVAALTAGVAQVTRQLSFGETLKLFES